MGRSISPMEEPVAGSDPSAAPRLIVPMSLRLAIPRRVALQQSSPPLHQPSVILKEKRKFEKEKPLNCMCANSKLSQQGGSPHSIVPTFVPTHRQMGTVAHSQPHATITTKLFCFSSNVENRRVVFGRPPALGASAPLELHRARKAQE